MMSQNKQDLYALLGVSPSAGTAAIEAAFAAAESAARAAGGEAWERLQYARDVLTSPQRRELYDSLLAERDTHDAPDEAAGRAIELNERIETAELFDHLLLVRHDTGGGVRLTVEVRPRQSLWRTP